MRETDVVPQHVGYIYDITLSRITDCQNIIKK